MNRRHFSICCGKMDSLNPRDHEGAVNENNSEECRLLECYAVWLMEEPTFRKNLAPPSSGGQESVGQEL
jgi:hypothetical protein